MEDEKKILEIDIETYSDVNLGDCGVYKYAESPNFEILLFGYSINGSPVQVIDLACGEEMPEKIKEAIQSKDVIKIAHNASFERICLSRYLGLPLFFYFRHCCLLYFSPLQPLYQSTAKQINHKTNQPQNQINHQYHKSTTTRKETARHY